MTRTVALACVLLLGGCHDGPAASHPPPLPNPVVTAGDNRRAAEAEADLVMAEFPAPDGAVRLPGQPADAGVMAGLASGGPITPNLVSRLAWWRVPGQADAVLAGIVGNAPGDATVTDGPRAGTYAQTAVSQEFIWPPVPGVFVERQLRVMVAQTGLDTLVRLDAVVVYRTPRPVGAYVPRSATALTVRMTAYSMHVTAADKYGPMAFADPAKVAAVAALADKAQVTVPGPPSCAAMVVDGGGGMTIDFTVGPNGPPVATLIINVFGCQGMILAVPGQPSIGLEGGVAQLNQVLRLLGLRWPAQP